MVKNLVPGALVKRMTALDNVMIGRLGSIPVLRSLLYGFNNREANQALDALEKVRIAHLAYRKVGSLSGVEMQRLAIARALFQNPVVLLADEPIANLDPRNARQIMHLLKPLADKMPIVGVFHQPDITMQYCTRIIAIKEGRVVYDGASDLSHEQLSDIYGAELTEVENAPPEKDSPPDDPEPETTIDAVKAAY